MNTDDTILELKRLVRVDAIAIVACALAMVWSPVVYWLGSGRLEALAAAIFFGAILVGASAIFALAEALRLIDRLEREEQQHNPWRSQPRGPINQEGPP
jgi:hypothetical protein